MAPGILFSYVWKWPVPSCLASGSCSFWMIPRRLLAGLRSQKIFRFRAKYEYFTTIKKIGRNAALFVSPICRRRNSGQTLILKSGRFDNNIRNNRLIRGLASVVRQDNSRHVAAKHFQGVLWLWTSTRRRLMGLEEQQKYLHWTEKKNWQI